MQFFFGNSNIGHNSMNKSPLLNLYFLRLSCSSLAIICVGAGLLTGITTHPAFAQTVGGTGGDSGNQGDGHPGKGGAPGQKGENGAPSKEQRRGGGGGGGGGAGGGKGGAGSQPNTADGNGGVGGDGGDGGAHGRVVSSGNDTNSSALTGVNGADGHEGGTYTDTGNFGLGGGGGGGGAGGYGLVVESSGTIDNTSTIDGGAGGKGGDGGWSKEMQTGFGGDGGGGGIGIWLHSNNILVTNKQTVRGGAGGQGGVSPGVNNSLGTDTGNGGDGGAGVYGLTKGLVVQNAQNAIISGGNGGAGGDGDVTSPRQSANTHGGSGGNGGAGIIGVLTVGNSGTISGGAGGYGGIGSQVTMPVLLSTNAVNGGVGGVGVQMMPATGDTTVPTLTNAGTVSGGNGGTGGDAKSVTGTGSSNGGNGGNGVEANKATITNSGTIAAGNGGDGGKIDAPDPGVGKAKNGKGGNGGDGIKGTSLSIINSGAITAGKGGAAGAGVAGVAGRDGLAINLDGGGNRLELRHGSDIQGLVTATGGDNVFVLGGDEDGTFSDFVAASVSGSEHYQGFQTLLKTGTSTWSVLGDYDGWQIRGGTLRIGNGGTQGSLNVGSIIDTGDATDKGTLSFDRSDDIPFNGTITGTGILQQEGTGTLILTNDTSNFFDYSGGTIIKAGTLQLGDGTTDGNITGDVVNDGTFVVNNVGTTQFDGMISGTGAFKQIGPGTTILTSDNGITGITTISAGTLQLGNNGTSGSVAGDIVNNATLSVNRSDSAASEFDLNNKISGTGNLVQAGSGFVKLSNEDNSYSGGTDVNAGTLEVGSDAVLGDLTGILTLNGGTLSAFGSDPFSINRSIVIGANNGTIETNEDLELLKDVSGADNFTKTGAGRLTLSGDSSAFTGSTTAADGRLIVNNTLGGTVDVSSGASVGGEGTVLGNATIASGATLVGAYGKTLTFNSDLVLQPGSIVDVSLGALPNTQQMFTVHGDLTLNGTLNVTASAPSGPGIYRIFQYDNQLLGNGLTLGTVNNSSPDNTWQIQNPSNQINLIHGANDGFAYWNGTVTQATGQIAGGDGTWDATTTNWTDKDGLVSGAWQDDKIAVFQADAGTVQVNGGGGTRQTGGLIFMSDGYHLKGDALAINKLNGYAPVIQVGDMNVDSKSWVATIDNVLQGSDGLNKTGNGILKLTADNTYTGNTTVSSGTLQLGNGGTTGMFKGDVHLDGTHFDDSTLIFDLAGRHEFAGSITGVGEVKQSGTGTIVYGGQNTYSGGLTLEHGKAEAGIADHAFGLGEVSIHSDATLDLANFNETIGGLAGDDHGDGNIMLGSGTLTVAQNFDSKFSGAITGTGGLTKTGSGNLSLFGSNSYSGLTTVADGALIQGKEGGLSAVSTYSVSNGASLNLGGFATSMASLSNSGTLQFGGTGGTVLTIAGDYSGNGGTLAMNTVLADDNAQTDMLKVGGNTSGSTVINFTNRGGLGTQTVNGIKVVDVTGASAGEFALKGDYVTKDGQQAILTPSAYAYTLQKNSKANPNDGNWYLVSQNTHAIDPVNPDDPTPRYSPAAPVYEAYASTLQALNKLPTLKQRVGDRYFNDVAASSANVSGASGETNGAAIWGRIEGAHDRMESRSTAGDLRQDINTFILQSGVDGQFYEDANGRLLAGITGQYGKAHSDVDNRTGDGSGELDTQAWGLGATATWYGNTGFYVDGQAQLNWYNSDLFSNDANLGLSNGNKGFGYALSAEVGKRFALDDHWSLTPQAQLMFSSVDFDTFTDHYGARISNHNSNSLAGRLGLAANYDSNWKGEDGKRVNANIYGIANLYQELLGGTAINYAGTRMNTNNNATWAGIGAGGTYAWADNKYSIYGEGSINTALNNFADSYALKGNIGLKVKW